jgi:hypothetical protein
MSDDFKSVTIDKINGGRVIYSEGGQPVSIQVQCIIAGTYGEVNIPFVDAKFLLSIIGALNE